MDFEFDSAKSEANERKHGIDFDEAKALWDDDNAYEIRARTDDEERFLVVGAINNILWTAVITHRNENVRIISFRRSRSKEVEVYDNRKKI